MLTDKPVLIVEDNCFLAIDLSDAIEELDGIVIGPTDQVTNALELVNSLQVAAAIVDCHLPNQDIVPLANCLAERRIPFVLHAEGELPTALGLAHPQVPVLRKPVQPHTILSFLMHEISRLTEAEVSNVMSSELGNAPKMV